MRCNFNKKASNHLQLMKSILFFIVAISLSMMACGQKNQIFIKGKLNGTKEVIKLSLEKLGEKNFESVAQTQTNAKGTFEVKYTSDKTEIYRLQLDEKNFLTLILAPGEKVELDLNYPQLKENPQVKGSPQSTLLYQVISETAKYSQKEDSIGQQIQVAQKTNQGMPENLIKAYMDNQEAKHAYFKQLASKNQDFLGWIFFAEELKNFEDVELLSMVDKSIYPKYDYIPYVGFLHQSFEVELATAIGMVAPDITLPTPDGSMLSLSSLKGKVVLLDFWASWCGPCRQENPHVVALYNECKDKGFDVFSVSLDKDKNAWINAIAKDQLSWKNHVSDLKYWQSEGAAIYGVTGIPFTVLLDRDGKIVAKRLRGDDLKQKVHELLKIN